MSIHSISISCDYEYKGYEFVKGYGTLFSNDDGEQTYFSVEFKMAACIQLKKTPYCLKIVTIKCFFDYRAIRDILLLSNNIDL